MVSQQQVQTSNTQQLLRGIARLIHAESKAIRALSCRQHQHLIARLRWQEIANRQSLVFSQRSQLLQAIPQIRIATRRMQSL